MLLNTACRKKEDHSCLTDWGLAERSLFPIGCAVSPDTLAGNSSYKKIVDEHFSSITAENVFKSGIIHPQPLLYDWRKSDQLVEYAQALGKRIHGHTLVWHTQLPRWIEEFKGSAEEWDHLLKDHIQTVTQRYRGKMAAWDVVNEAFNEDGTIRTTVWSENMGAGYIEQAFRYCHAADPGALLFYNDYLLEMNPRKRKAVLDHLDALRLKGVRVDGVGIQMHISTSFPEMQQVAEALNEIAARNYQIHLSETDISVNPFNKKINNKNELMQKQADILAAVVFHYRNIPRHLQYGITFWGVSDRDSWIRDHYKREDYPLLFDDEYQPKPAFCKLKELL